MLVSTYLRERASCIFEGRWHIAKGPLRQDWYPFVALTMPDPEETYDPEAGRVEGHVLRLCLAAAIAEGEGQ